MINRLFCLSIFVFLFSCSPRQGHQNYALIESGTSTLTEDPIVSDVPAVTNTPAEKEAIDYEAFRQLTEHVQAYREERRIDIGTFSKMLQQDEVILLDTRSAQAYRMIHIKGAAHLNFSDFTADKLSKVIPNKNTPILIYCNNNFETINPAFMAKSAALALNIPTFINLIGYGYENVYELNGSFTLEEARQFLELEEATPMMTPVSVGEEKE